MRRVIAASSIAVALFVSAVGVASADQDNGTSDAFLCPVVSSAVLDAPGADAFELGDNASFLPGKNQAGTHANANALNENGGPSATNVPGADGFTPIWNP